MPLFVLMFPAFNCRFLCCEGYPLHCYKQAGLTALSTLLNVMLPPAHSVPKKAPGYGPSSIR